MSTSPTPTLVYVAGIDDSGPEHWQRRWLASEGGHWVEHTSWSAPVRDEWVRELDDAIRAIDGPVFLVAHSLGCAVVTEWAAQHEHAGVVGALLVAVPDVHGPRFPTDAQGFAPATRRHLGFDTTVVVSEDDPYGTIEHSTRVAHDLGASLVNVGALGHINASSGLGAWPAGLDLLRSLVD